MPNNNIYPNTVVDIATEIKYDLGNDQSLSVAYISTWIRNSIGSLNNSIGTNYRIDENLEIYPSICNDEKEILKWLFICKYWDNVVRSYAGAGAYDPNDFIEIREGDSLIRKPSKNEFAKTAAGAAKECRESLRQITLYYKKNRALPTSLSSATSPRIMLIRRSDPQTPTSYPDDYYLSS